MGDGDVRDREKRSSGGGMRDEGKWWKGKREMRRGGRR